MEVITFGQQYGRVFELYSKKHLKNKSKLSRPRSSYISSNKARHVVIQNKYHSPYHQGKSAKLKSAKKSHEIDEMSGSLKSTLFKDV